MRLLYTGDYSRIPDRHMPPADLPEQRPHIVVVESTYGVSRHLPREEREARFVERIHTAVARGGRVLLPVVALGRAQELLLILEEYWERHPELHGVPIYQVGGRRWGVHMCSGGLAQQQGQQSTAGRTGAEARQLQQARPRPSCSTPAAHHRRPAAWRGAPSPCTRRGAGGRGGCFLRPAAACNAGLLALERQPAARAARSMLCSAQPLPPPPHPPPLPLNPNPTACPPARPTSR